MKLLICTIIFIIVWLIMVRLKSIKNGFRRQFIKEQFLPTLGIFLILLPFVLVALNKLETNNTTPADGFSIDSFTLKLNVNENNVVNVEEYIDIDFTSQGVGDYNPNYDSSKPISDDNPFMIKKSNKHGIIRFIPQWLKYTSKTGRTVSKKSYVNNLEAIGDSFTVDTINKKKRIKIGSAYEYVDLGIHNYIIKYDYDMGVDPYRGYDEFIFHAFGDYWGTNINNPKLIINMPKKITNEKISFFKDKKRNQDITKYMDVNVNGKTIEAIYNKDKCLKEKTDCDITKSITISIPLKEGYFKGTSDNYSFLTMILLQWVMLSTIIMFFIWLIFGKDYIRNTSVVEYEPPYGFDAAQMGYILYKANGKKMTISLIMSLAAKGYIQIHENEKEQYIINLCPKDGKFKDKETYIKHIPSNIKFNDESKLKPLSNAEKIVYDNLFSSGNIEKLSTDKSFYKTFEQVYDELDKTYNDMILDKQSKIIRALSIIILCMAILFSYVAFFGLEDLDPTYYEFYYLSFVCVGILFILSFIMTRKTKKGEEIEAKIKGFKEFLVKVEKDKLNTLVEENPNYFYEILPYTYMFNISKKWIKKFENIPEPINMGNFDYTNIDSLSSIADSISFPAKTYSLPSGFSSGGGCSSCGGGCSSCGGGCSSCGGGSSW